MANLPGTGPLPPLAGHTLPGAGNVPADHSIEAKWATMPAASKLALADMILLLNAHPELLEWAKVARVSLTPGATP